MDDSQTFNSSTLLSVALLCIAAAFMVVGVAMLRRLRGQRRSLDMMDQALAVRAGNAPMATEASSSTGRLAAATRAADSLGKRLGQGRLAEMLLAGEDRRLVDLAGYENPTTARARFIAIRFVLALGLPVLALLFDLGRGLHNSVFGVGIAVFFGFAVGYMLPKWVVVHRLARRKKEAADELPLLIDLLRLLQGVGLSIDQSMQVLIKEFAQVMPVLANELRQAAELYARGRTREQSLARLAGGFDNDDISAICRLIMQVDQHGGAVQEPLQRFGERLREKRRLELRERVGKTTVKMTGVMIITLLPALLIVTGGAGFLAVLRAMSRLGGS